jgi:hypothetical protein
MTDYDKKLDKAAKVLGANVIKMVTLILHKHDAAIIEASMDAIEAAREEEREACAKVLDEMAEKDKLSNYYQVAAIAIRARGDALAKLNQAAEDNGEEL